MKSVEKLWAIFSPRERVRGLALVAAMFLGAGFEAAGVGLIFPFIALINEPDLAFNSPTAKPILAALDIRDADQLLFSSGLGLLIFYCFKGCYLSYLYHTLYRFVFDKQVNLSRELLSGYLRAPYTFHLQRNTGELLKNTTETVHRFASGLMIALVITLGEILVIAALITLLVILAPMAALGAVLLLTVPIALFYPLVQRGLGRIGRGREHSFASMVRWVNQGLGSIKETKVLEGTGFYLDRHAVHARQYADAARTFLFVIQLPRFVIDSIAAMGMVAIVAVIMAGGRDLQTVMPLLGMFVVAAVRLMPSVNRIVSGVSSLRFHFAAAEVIYKELRDFREHQEVDVARRVGGLWPEGLPFSRTLTIDDLSFRYPASDELAVSKVSFTISKGHFVAFVGPTGCGKTTLVDLILGLLTPTEGRVLVDGRDIAENLGAWQRNIGLVPQEVYLSDDTIRRNVAVALPDSEIDDARVWEVLRAAHIGELVQSLPEGLDAPVGERGVRLSGGERQRLGIARALYRRPQLLVLDEATTSLDGETEGAIIRSLEELRGEVTIVAIAHRLSIVKNCDHLYYMRQGSIRDSGAYSNLLEVNHDFRQLVETGQ